MSSCVIFACTIITRQRLHVLHEFMEALKRDFNDCDIYVGINHVSLAVVEDIINSYGLKVVSMTRNTDHLYTQSDASAYQVAIGELMASKKTYDNYWFLHTKGGVNNHSDYLREWYIETFLKNRFEIECYVDSMPKIGSYGKLGLEFAKKKHYNETDCEIDLFQNKLSADLPCTHSNFFYIHTLYLIRRGPMDKFMSLITKKWLETKLDRYYFEGVFPFIVSRSGYFPYIENKYSCSGADLQPYIEDWIESNHLTEYEKYINIFKTDFLFSQLNPPYVNSNA